MKVKEIMTHSLVTVDTETTMRSAAELMKGHDIGALPVKKGAALEGIVTDRDIVVRAVAKGLDPNTTPIGTIMTTELVTCHEEDDINQVASLMREKQIRRLVVLDGNDRPSGVLSLGDIAAHGRLRVAAHALEEISEPVHSK